MLVIKVAKEIHGRDIADFQCRMAMETENLKLDKQMVEQAVEYLLKHKQFGQYFIPVEPQFPEKAQGSLLITYQNKQSWWIQSVYVRQQHRRKGVFTSLFKAATQKGKQCSAKSLQLYVQKQNERAIKTYEKLGMYCNGYQFCGYELVYGHTQVTKDLQSPIYASLEVENCQLEMQSQSGNNFEQISGRKSGKNRNLRCKLDNKVIANCEYFYEFSDWRFGLIIYINYFASASQNSTVCLQSFLKYLFQNCQLKVGAIRIIAKPQEIKKLQQILPSIHEDVYYVMQIDL